MSGSLLVMIMCASPRPILFYRWDIRPSRIVFFRHTIPSAYDVEMAIATIEDVIQATSVLRQVAQQASCADPYLKEIARITGSHDMLTQQQIEDVFNRVADVISGSPKRDGEFPDEIGFISYLVIVRELSHHLNIQQIMLV
ncbi:hypothetical protein [Dickeya ananatis]